MNRDLLIDHMLDQGFQDIYSILLKILLEMDNSPEQKEAVGLNYRRQSYFVV